MLMICLGFATVAFAQSGQPGQYTHKVTGNVAELRVVVKNLFAEIRIEGSDRTDILIETSSYEGIPDKAKGLKPLSASGPENTGIGLTVLQEGSDIIVSAASRQADGGEYVLKLPKNIKLLADLNHWSAGDLHISGMAAEVEAKTMSGQLILKNVTGPIVAYSLSGNVEVVFTSLNQNTPTSINTTSGDVDVTLPATTKASFVMGSVTGEVYTDLDFKFAQEGDLKRFGGGMSAKATLNGGGVEVMLKSVSGNVYVRKAK